MKNRIPLRFEGSKGSTSLYALFDSGATYSCISEAVVQHVEVTLRLRTPLRLAMEAECLDIYLRTRLDFYYQGTRMSDEFLVVPDLYEDVIIGQLTLQKWRLKTDLLNGRLIIDSRIKKPILINLI